MKRENIARLMAIVAIIAVVVFTGCVEEETQARVQDTDGDGLTNQQEMNAGTDPYNKDTDGDGYWDSKDENPLEQNIPIKQTPALTPSLSITPVPTPQINEEEDLVKQWLQMHGVDTDPSEDAGMVLYLMHVLEKWDVHPVEIYRGSLIFHEKSYGYIYLPDWEDDFRQMPPDITDTEFTNLVQKNEGTTTMIFDTEDSTWCACFPNLSDAENFLAEFWSV